LQKSVRHSAGEALPFDLRALEIFLAVADARSFTAAARRLGLTQSAVSQAAAQLEKQFDVRLFDRKVKPLALTVAGTILSRQAKTLLEEARRIVPAVREGAALKLPLVRVGMIDSLFPLLAPVLGVELRAYTDQLSIMSGLSDAHRDGLIERSIDVAISTDALEDIDGLERYPLLEDPYILLLPASRRGKESASLASLAAALPFVRYTERSQMGRQITLYLRRLRLDIPPGQAYDGTYGLIAMVSAGLGWAITTPLCMLDAPGLGERMLCAPLPPPSFSRRITLVARSGELGSIPLRIAALARQLFQTRCAVELARTMPWLGERFRVE
jgi:DNA-binding transcriptional LysR family regulator